MKNEIPENNYLNNNSYYYMLYIDYLNQFNNKQIYFDNTKILLQNYYNIDINNKDKLYYFLDFYVLK
jgi:hypothetical protein